MKVLYINTFDSSGYGVAGCSHALALDVVGVDVVCRRLDLGGSYQALPPRIAELEKKSAEGVTHVVQHSLPTHMRYDAGEVRRHVRLGDRQTTTALGPTPQSDGRRLGGER